MQKVNVTMSTKEIDRGELIRRAREKRLTQAKAASLMNISVRQVKRLCRRFKSGWIVGSGVAPAANAYAPEFMADYNLVVHFRGLTFLIVPSADTLGLAGRRMRLHESADGWENVIQAGDRPNSQARKTTTFPTPKQR
jgi:hypothetical protein